MVRYKYTQFFIWFWCWFLGTNVHRFEDIMDIWNQWKLLLKKTCKNLALVEGLNSCPTAYWPLWFSLVSKRYMTLPSKIVSSWENNWKVQNIVAKLCKIDLPVITVPNLSSYIHMPYYPEVTPYFFSKYYCAPFLPSLINIRKKSFHVSEMPCWISGFFFFLKCKNISDIAACNIPTLAQKQLFNGSQLANMKKCIPYMSLP